MTISRYHRQMLLAGIGEAGQARLRESHALLVGCGALGSAIADSLVRAGVGALTLIDRDIVEITNLQRQVLYDEDDVRQGRPKAIAAERKLRAINVEVEVRAIVDDFHAGNAERFVEGADVLLDGLDNFETRYLLNDLAVSRCLPYVYGGAVSTTGLGMVVLPRCEARAMEDDARITWDSALTTPCLRCLFPEAPPPGASPTCDTAGVLGPAVQMIAAWQSAQAIKLLTGNVGAVDRQMLSIDLWSNEIRRFSLGEGPHEDCPCCGQRRFDALQGEGGSLTTSLCGRNAVQVRPVGSGEALLDLARLCERLTAHGEFTVQPLVLRGRFYNERSVKGEAVELMLFSNGRAIIKGVTEPEAARALYAKYIGM